MPASHLFCHPAASRTSSSSASASSDQTWASAFELTRFVTEEVGVESPPVGNGQRFESMEVFQNWMTEIHFPASPAALPDDLTVEGKFKLPFHSRDATSAGITSIFKSTNGCNCEHTGLTPTKPGADDGSDSLVEETESKRSRMEEPHSLSPLTVGPPTREPRLEDLPLAGVLPPAVEEARPRCVYPSSFEEFRAASEPHQALIRYVSCCYCCSPRLFSFHYRELGFNPDTDLADGLALPSIYQENNL